MTVHYIMLRLVTRAVLGLLLGTTLPVSALLAAQDTPLLQAQPIYAPVPAPRVPAPAPEAVRGLFVNSWSFGSSRFYDLVRLADTTEINSFVIDVKDDSGYLTYPSPVPTSVDIPVTVSDTAPLP